jgi:hypothetical protein
MNPPRVHLPGASIKLIARKTVSVDARFQSFKVTPASKPEGSRASPQGDFALRNSETSHLLSFLRCFEQWLTMCKRVVIIKQFREFKSFADLRVRLQVSRDALAETSCENLRAWALSGKSLGDTRGYAGEADETERLRAGI